MSLSSNSDIESRNDRICPITGLTEAYRPEWTYINDKKEYQVSIRVLGDRIMISRNSGYATSDDITKSLAVAGKVEEEAIAEGCSYVQILDFTDLEGIAIDARRQYIESIRQNTRIKCMIFYGASSLFKMSIKLAKRINMIHFDTYIVDSYEDAVDIALQSMGEKTDHPAPCHDIIDGQDANPVKGRDSSCMTLDSPCSDRIQCYVDELLDFIGNIRWENDGMIDDVDVKDDHPLRAVFEAVTVIKHDFDDLLRKHLYAEEALRESEKKYRSVVENANEAIAVIQGGTIQYANNRLLKLLECEHDELIGTSFADYTHPGDIGRVKDLYERRLRGEDAPAEYSFRIIDRHGREKLIDISAILIDWDGDVATLVFLDDVTRRKEYENNLQESERRYREIYEGISELIYKHDLKGRFIETNLEFVSGLGYESEDVLDMNIEDIMPDRYRERFKGYLERVQSKGRDEGMIVVIAKDGSEHIMEYKSSLVYESGTPSCVRGLAVDVSERVKNQRELKKSEEKYRNILINMEESYYEVDLKGNMVFFNDAMCRMLGHSRDELQAMNYRIFVGNDSISRVYEVFHRVFESGCPSRVLDWEVVKKDGSKRSVEGSVALVRDSDGVPIGFSGIIRDTTEGKLAEKMREDKIKAEAENRSKSDFLANMSHEIRTPLNGIIGMTELAMDTSLDGNQKDIINAINRESEILLGLINDILDFSKIEAERYELENIPFDLRVLIEDLAGSFAIRFEKKGLELISFLSPDVPSLLMGDPGRLRQVLANLVGNAMKFTEKGEVLIKAELTKQEQDNVYIRFSVKDTGIGIPGEKQDKIFDIFTQADGSMTRKYGGTGLGLAISKQLTQLMGGEIGVESKEGVGSTFWFTVKLSLQNQNACPKSAEHVDLSALKVLVVDDNETNRLILMEYLNSWGCLAEEAPDGEGAIAVLHAAVALRERFDLIISDYQMPEMTGFDLAREIRKMESLKKIPMIILTSVGNIGEGKRCRQIGIQGYLTKPTRRDELRRVILSVLGLPHEEDDQDAVTLITRHTLAEETRGNVQILLAEDYPTNQQVAMRHLQKAGYHVDLAENGAQALAACKRKQYDLILMDIQMPVMDGYEATKKIRELEDRLSNEIASSGCSPFERIPVIAMTAHAMNGFREKCLEMGMDDYIAKPLRRQELIEIVDKWAMASGSLQKKAGQNENDSEKEESGMDMEPINFKRAMDEFDCDREFLLELLDGFVKNVKEQIGTIRGAISCNDAEKVRAEAHSIKGGAANICAERLSATAYDLEMVGKSGILDSASEVLDALEKEFHILEDYAEIN